MNNKGIWQRIKNMSATRSCIICNSRLALGEDILCTHCNILLPRTFYEKQPYDNAMAKELWGKLDIEKCAALLQIDGGSQAVQIVYTLKYNNRPDFGEKNGQANGKRI